MLCVTKKVNPQRCYDMSTLQTSGEFHQGIHPEMLQLRNVFTKRLCFICGPCEFIENKQKRESSPWVKGKKKPGPKKAKQRFAFWNGLCLFGFEFRAPDFVFRFYAHR